MFEAGFFDPQSGMTDAGGYRTAFDVTLPLTRTSWAAVRCYKQRPGGRERFAHTAPLHFDVPNPTSHCIGDARRLSI